MTKETKALSKGIRETIYQFKGGEVEELFLFDEEDIIRYCLCGALDSIKLRVLHFEFSNDVHIFIKDTYCGLVGGIYKIAYKLAGAKLTKEEL